MEVVEGTMERGAVIATVPVASPRAVSVVAGAGTFVRPAGGRRRGNAGITLTPAVPVSIPAVPVSIPAVAPALISLIAVSDRKLQAGVALVGAVVVAAAWGLRIAVVSARDRLTGCGWGRPGGSAATAGARRAGGRVARGWCRSPGAEMAAGVAARAAVAVAAATTTGRTAAAGTTTGATAGADGRRGELAGGRTHRSAPGSTAGRGGRRGSQLDVAAAGGDPRGRRPDVERHHPDEGHEDDGGTREDATGSSDADDEAL